MVGCISPDDHTASSNQPHHHHQMPTTTTTTGAITWVSASKGVPTEFRLYSHLFTVESPGDDSWEAELNPASLEVKPHGLGASRFRVGGLFI